MNHTTVLLCWLDFILAPSFTSSLAFFSFPVHVWSELVIPCKTGFSVRSVGIHTQPASVCHRRLKKVALARLKDYQLLLKCVMQEVADSTLLVVPHHRSGKVYTTHSHRAEPLSNRNLPAAAFLRLSQYMLVTNGRQIHPQCIHLQTSKSDPPPF